MQFEQQNSLDRASKFWNGLIVALSIDGKGDSYLQQTRPKNVFISNRSNEIMKKKLVPVSSPLNLKKNDLLSFH